MGRSPGRTRSLGTQNQQPDTGEKREDDGSEKAESCARKAERHILSAHPPLLLGIAGKPQAFSTHQITGSQASFLLLSTEARIGTRQ